MRYGSREMREANFAALVKTPYCWCASQTRSYARAWRRQEWGSIVHSKIRTAGPHTLTRPSRVDAHSTFAMVGVEASPLPACLVRLLRTASSAASAGCSAALLLLVQLSQAPPNGGSCPAAACESGAAAGSAWWRQREKEAEARGSKRWGWRDAGR